MNPTIVYKVIFSSREILNGDGKKYCMLKRAWFQHMYKLLFLSPVGDAINRSVYAGLHCWKKCISPHIQ